MKTTFLLIGLFFSTLSFSQTKIPASMLDQSSLELKIAGHNDVKHALKTPGTSTRFYSGRVSASGVVNTELGDFISGNCAKAGVGIFNCSHASPITEKNCTFSTINEDVNNGSTANVCKRFISQDNANFIQVRCFTDANASFATGLVDVPFTYFCHTLAP